jgi:hypothetical protein
LAETTRGHPGLEEEKMQINRKPWFPVEFDNGDGRRLALNAALARSKQQNVCYSSFAVLQFPKKWFKHVNTQQLQQQRTLLVIHMFVKLH